MDVRSWRRHATFWTAEYRRRLISWTVDRIPPDTALLIQQALERRSAPPSSSFGWENALFQTLVQDSRVVAPTTSLSFPVDEPAPATTGHVWGDVRVIRVTGVSVDCTTGLIFAGRRVLDPSGTGGRPARYLAFVSGSGLRLSAPGPRPRIEGPIAPIGAVVNYFHFLTDTAPRMLAVSRAFPEARLMMSGSDPRYAREIAGLLGLQVNRFDWAGVADCDDVVLCDTWPMEWPHPVLLAQFREAVISALPEPTVRLPLVYLSRRASARSVNDEARLEAQVEAWGGRVVRAEDLSFVEQVRLIRATDTIVAPHGAGLANLMFLSPQGRVIELTTGDWWNSCFRNMCAMLGIGHHLIVLPVSDGHEHGNAADAIRLLAPLVAHAE